MEKTLDISIASFHQYPSGRNDVDGEFNGTKFRNSILAPAVSAALASGSKVVVSLANVLSFGSSFLEEAFGGLVRSGVPKKDLLKVLEVEPGAVENERYRDAIFRYINRA